MDEKHGHTKDLIHDIESAAGKEALHSRIFSAGKHLILSLPSQSSEINGITGKKTFRFRYMSAYYQYMSGQVRASPYQFKPP